METLIEFIQALAIPFILVIIFYFSWKLAGGVTSGEKNLRSAKLGFWAGLVVLVLFVIIVNPPTGKSAFTIQEHDPRPIDVFIYTAVGLLVGSVMLGSIGYLQDKKPRPNWVRTSFLLGVVFLIAVTATTIALYGYIFIDHIQSEIAFITCGVMLGALVLLIYKPDVVDLG